jgi:DNA-binding response OmpR family regulator
MLGASWQDSMSVRILLIEDDQTVSELIAYNLRRAGYEVLVAFTGSEGVVMACTERYDLALVDLMLPELDGLNVCRQIAQSRPGAPFVIVSARSDPDIVNEALASGACSFVAKPFQFDLLLSHVKAGLKRAASASRLGNHAETSLHFGDTEVDREARVLRGPGGEIPINRKEYGLLELFFSEPGRLFPREEIVERVWHYRYLPASRTLSSHITRVRGKLIRVDAGVGIVNVRRVGYRLVVATPRVKQGSWVDSARGL